MLGWSTAALTTQFVMSSFHAESCVGILWEARRWLYRTAATSHTTERHCLGPEAVGFPRPSFNQFELLCPLSAWVPVW